MTISVHLANPAESTPPANKEQQPLSKTRKLTFLHILLPLQTTVCEDGNFWERAEVQNVDQFSLGTLHPHLFFREVGTVAQQD
jgi:hypothetical protein